MTLDDHAKAARLWDVLRAQVGELPVLHLYAVAGAYKKKAKYDDLPARVKQALNAIVKEMA